METLRVEEEEETDCSMKPEFRQVRIRSWVDNGPFRMVIREIRSEIPGMEFRLLDLRAVMLMTERVEKVSENALMLPVMIGCLRMGVLQQVVCVTSFRDAPLPLHASILRLALKY